MINLNAMIIQFCFQCVRMTMNNISTSDGLTPSINTPESSNDFIIFIIFISAFEINKLNPFSALTAPFPLIFLSNLYIAFEVNLLTNPGKLSVAKGIAIFLSAFFAKLTDQEAKDPPD